MAKFDVHLNRGGDYLLDCQADILSDLNTRLVVPLYPAESATPIDRRLNPEINVDGERFVMMTHFAAAVPERALGAWVASLKVHEYTIGGALDMLISGF